MKLSTPTQIHMIKFYPLLYHLYQFVEYPNSKCLPVQEVLIDANLLQNKRKKKNKERMETKKEKWAAQKKSHTTTIKKKPTKKGKGKCFYY